MTLWKLEHWPDRNVVVRVVVQAVDEAQARLMAAHHTGEMAFAVPASGWDEGEPLGARCEAVPAALGVVCSSRERGWL